MTTKTETFIAVVDFTDANGNYPAGADVTLAADTDVQLQEIATLLNYGVIKRKDK